MKNCWNYFTVVMCAALLLIGSTAARAVDVRVTIQSLSNSTGIAFSPLIASAHNGSVDNFDSGSAASAGVENVAELGSVGAMLINEILTAQPSAVAVPLANADSSFGPLLPGATQSAILSLDPVDNRYFSYLAMAVPSNDMFIGNDNPTARELFDAGGNFIGQNFMVNGSNIWDAGTEVNGLVGSAFIAGQDATAGADENGVIQPANLATAFSFYVGQTTGPGYVFSGGPAADTPIVAISFAVVPEPASFSLIGVGCIALLATMRRRTV